jgi:hypothetical protein
MNSKRLAGIAGILILIVNLVMGCLGDYGLIRKQPPTDNKMTSAELRKNWEDYHVYYGNKMDRPAAIMFDPKNDDTRLVGDSWIKIADQQTLSETIRIIQTVWVNGEVVIIEGPDRRFFGYMYYTWGDYTVSKPSEITVVLVDERTLYVGTIPPD